MQKTLNIVYLVFTSIGINICLHTYSHKKMKVSIHSAIGCWGWRIYSVKSIGVMPSRCTIRQLPLYKYITLYFSHHHNLQFYPSAHYLRRFRFQRRREFWACDKISFCVKWLHVSSSGAVQMTVHKLVSFWKLPLTREHDVIFTWKLRYKQVAYSIVALFRFLVRQ